MRIGKQTSRGEAGTSNLGSNHNDHVAIIMAELTLEMRRRLANNFQTVEDLGTHADRLAALLRAANNCNDHEDTSWLVSMALDEAELAEERYRAWGLAPNEDRE